MKQKFQGSHQLATTMASRHKHYTQFNQTVNFGYKFGVPVHCQQYMFSNTKTSIIVTTS